jgi:RNA polymerase sigma-70 factor (ECF subfamily)
MSMATHPADGAALDRTALFEQYRPRLFGIAYRMLGSVDDAQELTQEAYLRWHQASAVEIRAPEGWLVAVITRLSIDRLRSASWEREQYVGSWLPEPIATDAPSAPDRQAELASDLSMAFLVLLERLGPEERAAFLLREVLDAGYDEIARVLDRSEAACRQLIHRARERLRDERRQVAMSAQEKEALTERFLGALRSGDRDTLLSLVAPNATWTSDGGGIVTASRRVIVGADRITRLLLGMERKWPFVRHELTWLNGEPAVATSYGDQLVCTTAIEFSEDGMVAFYRMLNPNKLRHARRVPPGITAPSCSCADASRAGASPTP